MKSILKRILALTIAMVIMLFLPACGNGSEGENPTDPTVTTDPTESNTGNTENTRPLSNAKGAYHYKETVVASIDGGGAQFNEFLYFDENNNLIYSRNWPDAIYKIDGSGNKEELFLIPDRNEGWESPSDGDMTGYHAFRGYDIDKDGNYYILHSVMGTGDFVLDIYDKDGTPLQTDIAFDNVNDSDTYGMVKKLSFYDGKLFVLHNELQINDLDGQIVDHPFSGYLIDDFDIDDSGTMYLSVSINGNAGTYELLEVDIDDEYNIKKNISIPNIRFCHVSCAREMDAVFFGNYEKIYRYDTNSMTFEVEIDFDEHTALMLSNSSQSGLQVFENFAVNAVGEIYLITMVYGKGSSIYKLEKTAGEKPTKDIERTLTITAVYKQDYLQEAVRAYVYDNPEVEIIWDVMYETREELAENIETAPQKLAAKIMTNDVGDIVATGGMGLAYSDVLQTDAFIDLTEYIKNDANYNLLNKNVLDGMTLKGELKGLPIGTAYSKLVYNRELGDSYGLDIGTSVTWQQILDIGLANPDITLFGVPSDSSFVENIFITMLITQMPDLIDLEGKSVDLNQEWFLQLLSDVKTLKDQGNLYKPSNYTVFKSYDRPFLFEMLGIREYGQEKLFYQNAEGTIDLLPKPSGEKNRNAIAYPFLMYSISNNCTQKDAAWDFLSYLMTTGLQTNPSLGSSPINSEADQKIRERHSGFPDKMEEQFNVIINTIDYLYEMSYYKIDILEPLEEYLNDEITLEEAIEKAEYNVWLRLNE